MDESEQSPRLLLCVRFEIDSNQLIEVLKKREKAFDHIRDDSLIEFLSHKVATDSNAGRQPCGQWEIFGLQLFSGPSCYEGKRTN